MLSTSSSSGIALQLSHTHPTEKLQWLPPTPLREQIHLSAGWLPDRADGSVLDQQTIWSFRSATVGTTQIPCHSKLKCLRDTCLRRPPSSFWGKSWHCLQPCLSSPLWGSKDGPLPRTSLSDLSTSRKHTSHFSNSAVCWADDCTYYPAQSPVPCYLKSSCEIKVTAEWVPKEHAGPPFL